MAKKVLVVSASVAEEVGKALEEKGVWDDFDVVVVRDEEYDEIIAKQRDLLPPGKVLRDAIAEDFEQARKVEDGHQGG